MIFKAACFLRPETTNRSQCPAVRYEAGPAGSTPAARKTQPGRDIMKKLLVATGISILAMAAAAQAVDYAQADADGDGRVTIEEAKAAMPDASTAIIIAADTDGDGALSASEFEALASQ